MIELVFATNNQHKIDEINVALPQNIQLLKLKDIHCLEELPETHFTIEENAIEKATYVVENYKVSCFAEDTGLLIDELNGEPGVFSARYAGEQRNNEDNINLVLQKMEGKINRKAHFKTVIALHLNGNIHLFKGILNGEIIYERRGENGFGYDSIFQIEDGRTLAELTMEEKSKISHRAIATQKLVSFLNLYSITNKSI
ncbi:MAG: RdgB/HAM1 family non-canonical purine NTP pyrophosphatase [Chitinophagales bacterium]